MIFKKPYFIVLIIAILVTPYLNFGDFGAQILMFIIAISIPHGKYYLMSKKEMMLLCSVFVLAASYSLFLFLIGNLEFKYLSRGISTSLFRIIEVYFCYKLLRYYGKRSFYYFFCGLICAYSINIMLALFTYGVSGVLSTFFSIFTLGMSGGTNDTDEILESCHAVLLIMPFLSAYFLYDFIRNGKKQSAGVSVIAAVVSLMAFKRIAIAAAIVIFCVLLFKWLYNRFTLFFAGSFSIAIGLGYIFLISTGAIYLLSAQYGVDLMFRDRIWKALDDLYVFDSQFLGNGWGYTTKYLSENSERLLRGVSIGGLHNDLLKVYIDLGFGGFIFYFGFFLILYPLYLYRIKRKEVSFLFFICQLYLFMMYFTDNSQSYFVCQAVAYILPFAFAEANNKKRARSIMMQISLCEAVMKRL